MHDRGQAEKPAGVATENQSFVRRGQAEEPNFFEFEGRMEPGAVASENDFARASAFDGAHDVVETANAGRVGIDVWILGKLFNDTFVGAPVIRKAAEVGNDEINVRVFRGKHVNDMGFSGHIDKDRQFEVACGLANLAGGHMVVAMNFDAAESVPEDSLPDHFVHTVGIAPRVDHGEANQSVRQAADDAGDLAVALLIIGLKSGKDDGARDAGPGGTPQISAQGRVGVPGCGEEVAASGMTMEVNNHPFIL